MQKPIKKYSAGGINVAVWENYSTEGRQFNTVTLARNYKDKNDQWKTSSSMKVNDIPKAILALQKAYEALTLKDEKQEKQAIAPEIY